MLPILMVWTNIHAQTEGDSLEILSFNDFMKIVSKHHPMARQADLMVENGEAYLLNAKGGFDPKAITNVAQKYFDDGQYYSLVNGGLKLPTWFGLELQAGFEQNQGLYLNPEHKTPDVGLYYAGVSLSVGQGLIIDKRRAELQKAQAFLNISGMERLLMLNDLLYEAGKAYWDWYMAFNTLSVYREALQLAQTRFNAVKQGQLFGDRPAIDTLEAGIQVQNRRLFLQQAELDYQNTTARLSIYLWENGQIPLEPKSNVVPEFFTNTANTPVLDTNIPVILDSMIMEHPAIKQYLSKIEQLEIEKKWKKEQLKPVLNLKYNALVEPMGGETISSASMNNYNWGLEFSFPLLLRKERGALKMADIKIQDASYEVSTKQAALSYKVKAAFNEWTNMGNQVRLYQQTVNDYRSLLAGERRMFDAGESSLFMVNSRELGYINASIKLIELYTKNQKASLETTYALGRINNFVNEDIN